VLVTGKIMHCGEKGSMGNLAPFAKFCSELKSALKRSIFKKNKDVKYLMKFIPYCQI
jgi:hypothetical protein